MAGRESIVVIESRPVGITKPQIFCLMSVGDIWDGETGKLRHPADDPYIGTQASDIG